MTIVLSPSVTTRDYTTYDAFLDSQGLLFMGEGDTRSIPKEPPRTESGTNPNEITLESGKLFAQGDFRGGMGQVHAHQASSSPNKCFHLDGFDISKGTLKHLPEGKKTDGTHLSTPTIFAGLVQANGPLWTAKGRYLYATIVSPMLVNGSNDAVQVDIAPTDADTVTALTTDGINAYAAKGTDIYYGNSTSGAWATYLSLPTGETPQQLLYTRGRLIAITVTGKVYEVTTTAATQIDTIPNGYTATCIWESGRYIYVGARKGGFGRISFYGLNSGATAMELKGIQTLPTNTVPLSGADYMGQMLIGCGLVRQGTNISPVLFQAQAADTGHLTIVKVTHVESGASGDYGCRAVTAHDTGFYVGWTLPSDATFGSRDGLAFYDVARGAFSHSIKRDASPSTKPPLAIQVWNGWVCWITEDGLFYGNNQNVDTFITRSLTPQATYVSSIGDWNAPGIYKNFTKIRLRWKSQPAGTSISVYYSLKHPEENSWILAGTSTTANSTGASYSLTDVVGRAIAVKIVSNATSDGSAAPEIEGFEVVGFPAEENASDAEWQLVRNIRLLPKAKKPRGQWIYQNPNTVKSAIYDTLHTQVTLYEPDATWDVRVENIRTIKPADHIPSQTAGEPDKQPVFLQVEFRGKKIA